MRSRTSKTPTGGHDDLGTKLLASIRELKAGSYGRKTEVPINFALEARQRTGLTRNAFAKALAISPRTIQEWEQGRREPSGAAKSLRRIAHRYPEVIAVVLAQD